LLLGKLEKQTMHMSSASISELTVTSLVPTLIAALAAMASYGVSIVEGGVYGQSTGSIMQAAFRHASLSSIQVCSNRLLSKPIPIMS